MGKGFLELVPSIFVGLLIGGGVLFSVLILDGRSGKKARAGTGAENSPTVNAVSPPVGVAVVGPDEKSSRAGEQSQLSSPGYHEITSEQLMDLIVSAWPDDPDSAASIFYCESDAGAHPDTWDLSRPDGGPLQINRATWGPYFAEKYGWTWDQVVRDVEIHIAAAREIYDKRGDWSLWACSPNVG